MLATKFVVDLQAVNATSEPDFASMEGYLAGKFIVSALLSARMDRITSPEALMDSIYFNSMFTVEDVQLGLYSGNTCSSGALVVGCECSQGDSFRAGSFQIMLQYRTFAFILSRIDSKKCFFFDPCHLQQECIKCF